MEPYVDANAENGEAAPARPRHGCLWGCLTGLVAVIVVVAAVFSYGAHHFFRLLNDDAHVQTVMAALNASDEAKSVLGRNISVRSRQSWFYSYQTGRGGNASYDLKVIGSNGEGEAKAELDVSGSKDKIKSLVLTDSDGQKHYIVGAPPPNPMLQNSI